MKLRCRACKGEKEIKTTNSVGEMMERSGWNPIMDGMGEMGWVCVPCGIKIGKLARKIKSILASDDDKYIDFDTLLRFKVKP